MACLISYFPCELLSALLWTLFFVSRIQSQPFSYDEFGHSQNHVLDFCVCFDNWQFWPLFAMLSQCERRMLVTTRVNVSPSLCWEGGLKGDSHSFQVQAKIANLWYVIYKLFKTSNLSLVNSTLYVSKVQFYHCLHSNSVTSLWQANWKPLIHAILCFWL